VQSVALRRIVAQGAKEGHFDSSMCNLIVVIPSDVLEAGGSSSLDDFSARLPLVDSVEMTALLVIRHLEIICHSYQAVSI